MHTSSTAALAATARNITDPRELLETLRKEINAALDTVAAKHPGLAFKLGNCTYGSGGDFKYKLEGLLPGGTSREEQDYAGLVAYEAHEKVARLYSPATSSSPQVIKTPGRKLPPLGTSFTDDKGLIHKIIGATKRGRILSDVGGRRFTWPVDLVFNLTSRKGN